MVLINHEDETTVLMVIYLAEAITDEMDQEDAITNVMDREDETTNERGCTVTSPF